MAPAAPQRRFALDHNFPAPVLAAFAVMMPAVELVPVADIDPTFPTLDDWELFVALHHHPGQWDGLITNDEALLSLPKEMSVLSQTGLSLVVATGEGHNPVRAVGVLLSHLAHICHHTQPRLPQVWKLSVSQKNFDEPWKFLERIADKRSTTARELFQTHKLHNFGRRDP
jgi:hypothetical protein